MASFTIANDFVSTNPSTQQKLAVKAEATDLRLEGKISPMIAHGSGPNPVNIIKTFINLCFLFYYATK